MSGDVAPGGDDEPSAPRAMDRMWAGWRSTYVAAVGNGALMGCSCMFVMEMDEAYCRAWVKASPDVAKVAFDRANKRVESSAFISVAATAHFVDEKRGCVLE